MRARWMNAHRRFSQALISLACIGMALPGYAQSLFWAALVGALRQGGYVLVLRHTSSPPTAPEKTAADPDNVNLERQMDEKGRETARVLGEGIKRLHIPIGTVLSSPAYRALQTVKLAALGAPKTLSELNAGGQNMMQAGTDSARSAWLLQQVAVLPRSGSNTVIVTHGPNIIGAFGDVASSVADGEMLVFHPDGKGGAALVARIRVDEWPRLEAQK